MQLSHLDEGGNARMVDVSAKTIVKRTAVAQAHIRLLPATIALVRENGMKKGDVLGCARIAGICAAKRTAELIPLCHPLALDHAGVECSLDEAGVSIKATVVTTAKTGVEMEALAAASVAALTVYDMCKAVDKQMTIGDIRLISKTKEPLA